MIQNRSFTEYVAKQFYNELYEAINNYLQENKDDIDLRLYRVKNIDTINLADITVKFVDISDLPVMAIEFDVAVEAEIEVHERDYHYDETEECRQWFMLHCTGDLDCKLKDFAISSIDIYNSKNKQARPMSDALVPIIYKEQLEKEAENFLRKHYPKALLEPIWIDPQELAKNMGLTVRMANITKESSIFGRCYFNESETELYDIKTDSMIVETIREGTILVDKQAYFMQTIGRSNNTIVHECVHWGVHKKAFALARIYDKSLSSIGCEVIGGILENKRDAVDWMEWQANALTPRIQMPLEMFKKKANKIISTYRAKMHEYDMIDIIEPVIDQLAIDYGVSRTAAKIRMVDAGYEEAIGAFNYVDGSYVKPHKARKGYLERNKTFSIGAQDAAILCLTNSELKEKIEDTRYQYIDSHFVINHPIYVESDEESNLQLTHYARNHMDECCLVFELSVVNHYGERYHSECFLNRDESSLVDFNVAFHGGYENAPKESQLKLLQDTIAEENRIFLSLTNDFTAALKAVIDWRNEQIKADKKVHSNSQHSKITAVEIAERTKLNEATVRRTLNAGDTSTNTLVLICLALHLPYNISRHIIDHSPTPLRLNNVDHQWYDFALRMHSGKTVEEVKALLQSYGANPL